MQGAFLPFLHSKYERNHNFPFSERRSFQKRLCSTILHISQMLYLKLSTLLLAQWHWPAKNFAAPRHGPPVVDGCGTTTGTESTRPKTDILDFLTIIGP